MPDIPRQRTAPRLPRRHKPVRVGADLRRHRPPGKVQNGCGFHSPPARAQGPETHAAGRHRAHTPCSPCRSVRPHRGWPDQAHVRKPAAGRAAHRNPALPKTPCPAPPTRPRCATPCAPPTGRPGRRACAPTAARCGPAGPKASYTFHSGQVPPILPMRCRLDTAEEVSVYEAGGMLQRFAQDFLAARAAVAPSPQPLSHQGRGASAQ